MGPYWMDCRKVRPSVFDDNCHQRQCEDLGLGACTSRSYTADSWIAGPDLSRDDTVNGIDEEYSKGFLGES